MSAEQLPPVLPRQRRRRLLQFPQCAAPSPVATCRAPAAWPAPDSSRRRGPGLQHRPTAPPGTGPAETVYARDCNGRRPVSGVEPMTCRNAASDSVSRPSSRRTTPMLLSACGLSGSQGERVLERRQRFGGPIELAERRAEIGPRRREAWQQVAAVWNDSLAFTMSSMRSHNLPRSKWAAGQSGASATASSRSRAAASKSFTSMQALAVATSAAAVRPARSAVDALLQPLGRIGEAGRRARQTRHVPRGRTGRHQQATRPCFSSPADHSASRYARCVVTSRVLLVDDPGMRHPFRRPGSRQARREALESRGIERAIPRGAARLSPRPGVFLRPGFNPAAGGRDVGNDHDATGRHRLLRIAREAQETPFAARRSACR